MRKARCQRFAQSRGTFGWLNAFGSRTRAPPVERLTRAKLADGRTTATRNTEPPSRRSGAPVPASRAGSPWRAGRPVELTATEFGLLRVPSDKAGRAMSFYSLRRLAWGRDDVKRGAPKQVRTGCESPPPKRPQTWRSSVASGQHPSRTLMAFSLDRKYPLFFFLA